MTTPRLEAVGLVANYSPAGDRAFETAFRLAREYGARLNIFRFAGSVAGESLAVPAEAGGEAGGTAGTAAEERILRERWEERLGDFTEVGFRVCGSARHNLELRRCLRKREYQLLVIPCDGPEATFGGMPLEEFAYRFTAPVVLVGAEPADKLRLSPAGRVWAESREWPLPGWTLIPAPKTLKPSPVL